MATETSYLLANNDAIPDEPSNNYHETSLTSSQSIVPYEEYDIEHSRPIPPVPLGRLKSVSTAYLLWFPFGWLGSHHFYLKNVPMGVGYLATFGLFGLGWLMDVFRLPMLVKDANMEIEAKWIWEQEIHSKKSIRADDQTFQYETTKRLSDCYLLWVTTGVLGFHHHYLGRHGWGLLYLCTLGLFGIGYISDLVRMPLHLKRYNELREQKEAGLASKTYHLDEAYVTCIAAGIFGLHNFYLGRKGWGLLYVFSLGILGFGWVMDLLRLPCLVEDANLKSRSSLSLLEETIEEGAKYELMDGDTFGSIDPLYSDYNSCFTGQQRRLSNSDEDEYGTSFEGEALSHDITSPPPSYSHLTGSMENLSSSDSTPSNRADDWNSDSDHSLSYF